MDNRSISFRPIRDDDREFLYRVYASTREEELAQRNSMTLFLGATTSEDETNPSLGLEYEYRISMLAGVGATAEFTFESEEREFIALLPFYAHFDRTKTTLGLGVERSRERSESEGSEEATPAASDFLVRVGMEQ